MTTYKKTDETSYALGTQATFYLLDSKMTEAKRVYISPKQTRDETYFKLVKLCREYKIPVIENNEKIFKALSNKDNTMVIGEFDKWSSELEKQSNHVVLVNPMNMGNLGTIMRCLVGFNVRDLAIITPSSDPFDPKVIRASMGAIFHIRIHRFSSFEEYQNAYTSRFFYPFMLKGSAELDKATRQGPWSLIFGNEATGLPDSFSLIGTPIRIPQSKDIDSLNLDNAVAIGLYQFTR